MYPEDLSVEEQIKSFKDAEVIVSIHGAGLVNAIHTQGHKCKVLELNTQYYHDPSFVILNDVLDIEHYQIFGKTEDVSMHVQQENVYIDVNEFQNTLEKILK